MVFQRYPTDKIGEIDGEKYNAQVVYAIDGGNASEIYSTRQVWESISATTGTATSWDNVSVATEKWSAGTNNALVVEIDSGKPIDTAATDSSGNVITANIDADSNFTLSGTPSSFPVALVWIVRGTLSALGQIPVTYIIDEYDDDKFYNVKYIDFDTTFAGAMQEGRVAWNSDDGTLDIGMPGGKVILQVGQEIYLPDRPKNTQGTQINNGQAVYLSDATGAVPEVKLANASNTTAPKTLAVATQNVTDQQRGYYTVFGVVRDFDTASIGSDGEEVFLDATDGGLTTDKLDYPNTRVKIGYIIRSHASEGVLFVTIQAEQWLRRFQAYENPTGFYNRTDSTLSYDAGTRVPTVTLAGGSSYYSIFSRGEEQRYTTSITITGHADTTGGYYFYLDNDFNVQLDTSGWEFSEMPIMYIYYNSDKADAFVFEERHGCQRNCKWHEGQHNTIGTYYKDGLAASGYTLDTDTDAANSYAIASGNIMDEDIQNAIAGVADGGDYYLFYRSGATGEWTWETNTLPFLVGGSYIEYNEFTGATWQLTELSTMNFVNYYVFAVPEITGSKTIVIVPGQNVYSSLSAAQGASLADDIDKGSDFPFIEFAYIHRFTYGSNASYTSTGKVETKAYFDARGSTTAAIILNSTPATNHNALSNLQLAQSGVTYGHIDDQAQTIAGDKTFADDVIIASTGNLIVQSGNEVIPAASITGAVAGGGINIAGDSTDITGGRIYLSDSVSSYGRLMSGSDNMLTWAADTLLINRAYNNVDTTIYGINASSKLVYDAGESAVGINKDTDQTNFPNVDLFINGELQVDGDKIWFSETNDWIGYSGDEYMNFNFGNTEVFRVADILSTGNESSPDASPGGLTLQQNTQDGNILTFKSTDVNHSMTSIAEADTYAQFKKNNSSYGGLRIEAFTESASVNPLKIRAITGSTNPSSSSYAPISLDMMKYNGSTSATALSATDVAMVWESNGGDEVIMYGNGSTEWLNGRVVWNVATTTSTSITDYDVSAINVLFLTGTSTITVNSFDGGKAGQVLYLINKTTQTLSLTHNYGAGRQPILRPGATSTSDTADYGSRFYVCDGTYWYEMR